MPRTHQQRMLAAIEQALENWTTPLEMTWDQTVASNRGFIGAVAPGGVIASKRVHADFQADYATFKPVDSNGHISDRKAAWYVNFSSTDADTKFKQVIAYLCGEE